MINRKDTRINFISLIVLLGSLWFGIGSARAEGSKDLYPENARGGRAYLRANLEEIFAFPFPTLGTHYVYAEEGEQIALASSEQVRSKRHFKLFSPKGEEITLSVPSYDSGIIPSREAELAGPLLPGQRTGEKRYKPIYYTVPPGGSGVYRIDFYGRDGSTSGAFKTYGYSPASEWPGKLEYTNYLIAWDISVAKQTNNEWKWINGRVFTTMIAMSNPSFEGNQFIPDSGFYGTFKVLTKDGYIYNVENNGHQGYSFTFMVNNQGFHKIDDPTTPAYESIPTTKPAHIQDRYHDPRTADTDVVVTHKIFYNLPDKAMPQQAPAAMENGSTWLKIPEKDLQITNIRVEGAEGGGVNQGGSGAYIKFVNDSGGEYTITIAPKAGMTFTPRILKGVSKSGDNGIYWDGKDGEGKPVPAGKVDLNIDIQIHGAEVHFPFIDVELNQYGIIIELLSSDGQTVRSDKVYWDDTSIGDGGGNFGSKPNPRNASHMVLEEGISSRENGHIWGVGTANTDYTFGDIHGIDTWTFIKGNTVSAQFEVEIKIADLEVVSVVADKEKVEKGGEVTYEVVVKNNGPDDVQYAPFLFQIPQGFEVVRTAFDPRGCGIEREELTFDQENHRLKSLLDLRNQCEVTYTLTLKEKNATAGVLVVEGAILRPKDVRDPDATNQDEKQLPVDPHYECENNGLEIPCNNLKENTAVRFSYAALDVLLEGRFTDLNNDGFAQVGEEITYRVKLVNTGKTKLADVVLSDPLFGGVITVDPVKNPDSDEMLDVGDVWTYTLTYRLTEADLANEGVYNQMIVQAVDTVWEETIEFESKPTQPLDPTNPKYDPNRPNHTYVFLKVNKLLNTNPMVRQRIKNTF